MSSNFYVIHDKRNPSTKHKHSVGSEKQPPYQLSFPCKHTGFSRYTQFSRYWQRWQQVIFCKSKSSHKSFPYKSKSSHKSFPCKSKSSHKSFPCKSKSSHKSFPRKSKSSHKSFGQTSSQVTSHLVQTQVKSQVSLSKYKSSRTLFLPLP